MENDPPAAAVMQQIAFSIHRFSQRFPNHYACAALAGIINRLADGEDVPNDERELVISTLIRSIKDEARNRRFGPPSSD